MGFVPPKIVKPRRSTPRLTKDEHPLAEEWNQMDPEPPICDPQGQSNRALLALMKRLQREIAESSPVYYTQDGQRIVPPSGPGGIVPISRVDPLLIGKEQR